jgi:aspartate/methionine/tyrosine aminotransferase
MDLAHRMSNLGTETAFEVLAKAKGLEAQGKDIVHLEIGEPDFDTPANIIEAAVEALHDHYTHYGPSAGQPEFREVIAKHLAKTRGIKAEADNVVVTPGAKPIMFFTMLAIVNEGDEVIYPDPGFPIYESMVGFLGGVKKPILLREERDFRFDVNELADLITDKTRLIVLNSPQNPTGGMLDAKDLEDIAEIVRDRDLMILSDEIYSEIIYDGQHHSITSLPGMLEKTIILDGFSKTYAMTGWRLGYGLFPTPGLAALIAKLQVNATSCTAAFTQQAGIEALTGDQSGARAMLEEFRGRRDVIVDGLNEIPGVTCKMPRGAFYVFPNIKSFGKTSQEMADMLLYEAGVAALPGTSFGPGGEGYLRFSYANSTENIQLALGRIGERLAALTT